MEGKGEEEAIDNQQPRGRHIKKRALRNKSLSVTFDEKDLRDYVTGFHKRKKKRRKEAQKLQEDAKRRHRIELRKKRKLEKEFVLYGGAPPAEEEDEDLDKEEDGDEEQITTASGTTTYDKGELKVTVTTSEIAREEDDDPAGKTQAGTARLVPRDKKNNLGISKNKTFKKVVKRKARPKHQNKRDKRKGGKNSRSK